MSERFTYADGKLFDNQYGTFHRIYDSEENIKLFCERLNRLDEKFERFVVDDCGALIDMETRNTYDYVSDVAMLLNSLNNQLVGIKKDLSSMELECEKCTAGYEKELEELRERNKRQYNRLKEVWDLIFDRNWVGLEKKAQEVEENEKLLKEEWGKW